MPSTSSLDALLDKIKADSALELSQDPVTAPLSVSVRSGHLSAQALEQAAPNPVHERNEMWESNLTPHQRTLPKIPSHMLGGILALMILMVGVGSATLLTQENQDVRQQAYEDTVPELAGTSATLTQAEYEAQLESPGSIDTSVMDQSQAWGTFLQRSWTTTQILVVTVSALSIVAVLTFLAWVLFF